MQQCVKWINLILGSLHRRGSGILIQEAAEAVRREGGGGMEARGRAVERPGTAEPPLPLMTRGKAVGAAAPADAARATSVDG